MSKGNSDARDRQCKRKQWKDEDMVAAMEAATSGEMTVSASSRVFNVPRKTLDDRLKGHVIHGTKPGVTTVLTSEEENSLIKYLLYMAERGFPLTRTMVKAFSWAIFLSAQVLIVDLIKSKDPVSTGGSCLKIDTLIFVFESQTVLNAVMLRLSTQ